MAGSARSPGTPPLEIGALHPGDDLPVCPALSGAARVGSGVGVGGAAAGVGFEVAVGVGDTTVGVGFAVAVGVGGMVVGVGFGVAVGITKVGVGVAVAGGCVGVGEGRGVAGWRSGMGRSGSSGEGKGSKPVAVRHRLSRP